MANPVKVIDRLTTAIASACIHMPQAISHFRPIRSESAPVTSCPTPHIAG